MGQQVYSGLAGFDTIQASIGRVKSGWNDYESLPER